MKDPKQQPQPFRFPDPRQQRIYQELNELVGPGPAVFFRDACWLMSNPHVLQSTSHLVGHLLRDIESALRQVFRPLSKSGDEESTEESPRESQKSCTTHKKDTHKEEIRDILHLLKIPEDSIAAEAWLQLVGNQHRFAHRRGLDAPRSVDEIREIWDSVQEWLDVLLRALREKFLRWISLLDELLQIPQPTKKDLKRLSQDVPNNYVLRKYFFGQLANPEWLEPLRAKGFFKQPPQPEPNEAEGTIRFPRWPEGQYLARMARHKPKVVAQILQEADDTDNVAVLADFVDALLAMPVEISAGLAGEVARWAQRPYGPPPEKLTEIIAHWSRSGHTKEAWQVARVLFEVLLLEPRAESGSTGAYRPPEPQYRSILREHYPELVKATGFPALELLCDLLEKAIHPSQRDANDRETEDCSSPGRPAVEDHPQNLAYTIPVAVVSALKDAADLLVRSGLATVEEVVQALERRRCKVFRRIALYLLAAFPDRAEGLAAERLTDRALFDDLDLRHEYTLLLRARFPRLSPQDQATILGWIETGPDVEDIQREEEQAPSEVETARLREIWQRDWLARIGPDNLPPDWRKLYDELTRRYGEPEDPEFLVYGECCSTEPTSPRTADELKAMAVEEIVEFLRRWTPPKNFLGRAVSGGSWPRALVRHSRGPRAVCP